MTVQMDIDGEHREDVKLACCRASKTRSYDDRLFRVTIVYADITNDRITLLVDVR